MATGDIGIPEMPKTPTGWAPYNPDDPNAPRAPVSPLGAWGAWNPALPAPWDYMAGTGSAGSNTGGWQADPRANPWGWANAFSGVLSDPKWWQSAQNQSAIQAYSAAMQPFYQYQQNAYQYAKDFNEAQRRWNEEMSWNQSRDAYNMALTTRQQNAAEDQWGKTFGQQQLQDWRTWDLSNRQFAEQQLGNWRTWDLGNRQFAHAQDQDIWGRGFQEKQLAEQGKQARYAAFGRAQAPSATWARNW